MKYEIYAYSFNGNETKIGMVTLTKKCYKGLTPEKAVKKRIRGQLHTPGHPEVTMPPFLKSFPSDITDYEVKKQLQKEGVLFGPHIDHDGEETIVGKSSEWTSNCSFDVVIEKIQVILNEGQSHVGDWEKDLILRKGSQDVAVEKAINWYKIGNYFLLAMKTRGGKTVTAYSIAKQLGAENILVLCYRPSDTFGSWRDDLYKYKTFYGWNFSSNGTRQKVCGNWDPNAPVNVYFSSVQIMGEIKNNEVTDFIKSKKWDLIIVDESHIGAHSDEFFQ